MLHLMKSRQIISLYLNKIGRRLLLLCRQDQEKQLCFSDELQQEVKRMFEMSK